MDLRRDVKLNGSMIKELGSYYYAILFCYILLFNSSLNSFHRLFIKYDTIDKINNFKAIFSQ